MGEKVRNRKEEVERQEKVMRLKNGYVFLFQCIICSGGQIFFFFFVVQVQLCLDKRG